MHGPISRNRLPQHSTRWPLVTSAALAACSLQVPPESKVFSSDAFGGSSSRGGASNTVSGGIAGLSSTAADGGQTSVGGVGVSGATATPGGTGGVGEAGGTNSGIPSGGMSTSGGGATAGSVAAGGTASGGSSNTGGDATAGSVAAGGTASGGSSNTGGDATAGSVAAGGTASGGTMATGGTTSIPLPPAVAILKYDFDSTTDTVAKDATTNGHDGTLSHVTLSGTGRNGGGVAYAGTDAAVSLPSGILSGAQMLNVSVWVKLTANSEGNRVFSFGDEINSHLYLTLNDGNATPGISLKYLVAGGSEKALTTATQLPLGVWKHIAVTMTAAGAAIYIDGKIVAQDKSLIIDPSSLSAGTENVVGNSVGRTNAFAGTIDEFYMYDGGLTRNDILTLAAPKMDYSIFHFDEGTGAATQDSSDRKKDGVLVGGANWGPGVLGTAVNLDNPAIPGTQYVKLASGLIQDCSTNLTVAGWVNLAAKNPLASLFLVAPDSTALIRFSTAYKSAPDLTFQMSYSGTRWTTARATQTWVLGTWYHVAIVRSGDGTTLAFYVNGVQNTNIFSDWASTLSFATWGATAQNYFGKDRDDLASTTYGLHGSIDEILISCRAYTASEIAQLAYKP